MENTPAVHHALEAVTRCGEMFRNLLIGDHDNAVVGEHRAGVTQHVRRFGQVVQRLENQYEIV